MKYSHSPHSIKITSNRRQTQIAIGMAFVVRLFAYLRSRFVRPTDVEAPAPIHPIITRALEILDKASQAGHACVPFSELAMRLAKSYAITTLEAESWLREAVANNQLVADANLNIFTPELWDAEATITDKLAAVGKYAKRISQSAVEQFLLSYPLDLSRTQREAVITAAQHGVMVLTGYPGTGKTTTINAILDLFTSRGMIVRLAAPTGRAAQRMSEATGRTAQTLHRLLHFCSNAKTYLWTFLFPVVGDVLILDEASMIDTRMMAQVLKATSPRVRLIIVGDPDQLESVEAGNVLADIIASQSIPVVTLTEVRRQDPNSWIARNAAAIRENRPEDLHFTVPGEGKGDCYFIEANDPAAIQAKLAQAIGTSLPRRLGYDPLNDIQALVPMKKGPIGTLNLNEMLRGRHAQAQFQHGESLAFQLHDKVIHIQNDYDLNAMNGEVGEIVAIDNESLTVRYPTRDVTYPPDTWVELQLASTITIHKSQGSQWPCVVIVVHENHKFMLTRRVVYTALTRASKHVVFIGQRKALNEAIARVPTRYTGLKRKLHETGINRYGK